MTTAALTSLTVSHLVSFEIHAVHPVVVIVNLEFELVTHLVVALPIYDHCLGVEIGAVTTSLMDVLVEELKDVEVASDVLVHLPLDVFVVFLGIATD